MLLLGYDIGSSSIKASVVDAANGRLVASAVSPEKELPIDSPEPGWAEQHPELWWKHVKIVTGKLLESDEVIAGDIEAIGISYQMHGLVLVDKNQKILRPSIIWCDGRAVETGQKALNELGRDYCLKHFLNSPGNFTASKLRWVKEHEPDVFKSAHKFMLPGDYIGMKLTGEIVTTFSGLSEGILWDYRCGGIASKLTDYYEIPDHLVPETHSNFSMHGTLSDGAAKALGLRPGVKVTYRAGDQPNNALSLNVLDPGEVAATAGTSGVIYGVTDQPLYDEKSRVNTFIHVNYKEDKPRYGVLLCINGTGIQNSWIKNRMFRNTATYDSMNDMAAEIPAGSEGVRVLPFGNGPERCLENREIGGQILNLDFNRHTEHHVARAAQEGIAFSLNYGLRIMKTMGLEMDTIRVGKTNMFLSPVFTEAFTNTTGIVVERYKTDGSQGAAIGAGMGAGVFGSREEAFASLEKVDTIEPDPKIESRYQEVYQDWERVLKINLK